MAALAFEAAKTYAPRGVNRGVFGPAQVTRSVSEGVLSRVRPRFLKLRSGERRGVTPFALHGVSFDWGSLTKRQEPVPVN
jgi:hypothetical protein